MKICSKCNLPKEENKFVKSKDKKGVSRRRSYCYQCRWKKEKNKVNKIKMRSYYKKYYNKNAKLAVYKAYRWNDQQKGFLDTVSKQEFDQLINLPCFYCNETIAGGLDRIDNNKGHSFINSRSCCEKCNIILGDLPDEAKLLLKPSLLKIRERGLLNQWIIPTKRKKKL